MSSGKLAHGLSIIDQVVSGLRDQDEDTLAEAKMILQYIVDHGGFDELVAVFRGMQIQGDMMQESQ